MNCCPQLTTVPGVSLLFCASLSWQNEAAATLKAISILNFMVRDSSRYLLPVELKLGRTHSRPAMGDWRASRNVFNRSRLGRASSAAPECEISAFPGEQQCRAGQMVHGFAVW